MIKGLKILASKGTTCLSAVRTVLLQTGELAENDISIGTVHWYMYMQTLWCFEILVIIVNKAIRFSQYHCLFARSVNFFGKHIATITELVYR